MKANPLKLVFSLEANLKCGAVVQFLIYFVRITASLPDVEHSKVE